ncbi:carboxymuconolactone decarboxylase family protein [Cupriavidus necator]
MYSITPPSPTARFPCSRSRLLPWQLALTTQCPYCIALHTKAGHDAGATNAKLAEATLVAAAIRAGGAVTHATHLFRD